jgi:glycosyltransferase EpsD
MLSARRPRVVNVVHGYLFDDDTPPLRRWVMLSAERFTRGVTDEILVMNARDERIARENRLCRGEIALIPGMGVPLERYPAVSPEERAVAKKSLGLPEGAFVLVCAAEFSKRKNQALLLKALALLPEDVYLLLPGDGELLKNCRTLAVELGVDHRIRFPGHVKDVRPYLRAADVCVSASRSEGLPFHVMEAMGSGIPCVLSEVKGHEDLLSGGECGLLYPYGDAAALAVAAEKLRKDTDLRRRLGAQGSERVKQYALEKAMSMILPRFLKARKA